MIKINNRDKYFEQGKRLVYYLVKKYNAGKLDNDACQEGFCGLMEAINRYNPVFKVKFPTYAYYWISKYVFDYYRLEATMQNNVRYNAEILETLPAIESESSFDLEVFKKVLTNTEYALLEEYYFGTDIGTITLADVANRYGMSEEWARMGIKKAIFKIKKYLKEEGEEEYACKFIG